MQKLLLKNETSKRKISQKGKPFLMHLRIFLSLVIVCSLFLSTSMFAQDSDAIPNIDIVNFYYPKNAYKFKVSEEINSYIRDLKRFMESNDEANVKLDGYSFDGSNDEWNTRVSKYRVRAVRDLLIDAGIDKERIEIEYFGKAKHLAKDDSTKELAKNRRVELRIFQQG